MIVSGGLNDADHVHWVFEYTGAAAVMLARGSLGNPWLFEQVLGTRDGDPTATRSCEEWQWVIDRAEEHLGADRAVRYLRKFHPWYLERLGGARRSRTPCSGRRRSPISARSSTVCATLWPPEAAVLSCATAPNV